MKEVQGEVGKERGTHGRSGRGRRNEERGGEVKTGAGGDWKGVEMGEVGGV